MKKTTAVQLQVEAPQINGITAKAEKLRDTLKEAKSLADDLASMVIELEVKIKR